MNFSNILSEIERLDPEVYERTSQRRDVIKNWSRKVALAAVPFALGSLFKKAYGKGTATILEVLNYALTLEYLESEFYNKVLTTGTFTFPTEIDRNTIGLIGQHEKKHVKFLQDTIIAMGQTPVPVPIFDFTGANGANNGPFSAAFSNYPTFLSVAQVLEDTGVRAYKGAVADLMSDNDVLTAAMNIHSVEARHAAHIRHMRKRFNQDYTVKPWVTGNDGAVIPSSLAPLVADNYAGEENTSQANVNIIGLGGLLISANSATEAFDEPLSMTQVLTILDPFLA